MLLAATLLVLVVPTMVRADDADTEKQVAMLSKQSFDALVKGDTTALDAILADDWMVINPDGNMVSKSQQAKELTDGTTDFLAMDPSEVKVRVYGDAAVVTSRYQSKLKYKGQEVGGPVRISEFYAKQGGKWRCVSAQVTHIAGQSSESR